MGENNTMSSLLTSSDVSTALLVSVGVVAVTVIIWLLSRLSNDSTGIPGSSTIPLIGDSLAFMRALSSDGLRQFWEKKAAKFGPLFKMNVFGGTVVVMDPPAGIKFFFVNENKLFNTYWPAPYARLLGADSIANQIGEAHRIVRRHIVNNFLGPDTVWGYIHKVERLVHAHLDEHWHAGRQLNTYKLAKEITFHLICDLSMSTKSEETEEIRHGFEPWVAGLMKLPINLPGFAYYSATKARIHLHTILDRLISRRRAAIRSGSADVPKDLLTALITIPDERAHMFTDGEIKDNLQFLLAAGHETSSAVLTLTIRNIAKYPEVYQTILKEQMQIAADKKAAGEGENYHLTPDDIKRMEYTWRAVLETMRVNPVVDVGMRIATQDFQYKGYSIRKGWKILWSQDRCSYEPTFFQNPGAFEPERFKTTPTPFTYLPFGGGPRACPGNDFAKMEILVFLHYLMKNYTWSIVDPSEGIIRDFVPMCTKGSLISLDEVKLF